MINKILRTASGLMGYELVRKTKHLTDFPPDLAESDIRIIERVRPFTMTSLERIVAVVDAIKYIHTNSIPGAIVECGVWRGGSMMAVANTLIEMGGAVRDLFLFDTFEGMTPPSEIDLDHNGVAARKILSRENRSDPQSAWCYATLEEVAENMRLTGYPESKIHLVKGKVEDTIPDNCPQAISLLRLDTDWYESTRHELVHLYPRLSKLGVLIIDDYGHWKGAKKAVDEYFGQLELKPLLHRIDYTARLLIKP